MKLIQRRAYGFKNFDNYGLRVKVLYGRSNMRFRRRCACSWCGPVFGGEPPNWYRAPQKRKKGYDLRHNPLKILVELEAIKPTTF